MNLYGWVALPTLCLGLGYLLGREDRPGRRLRRDREMYDLGRSVERASQHRHVHPAGRHLHLAPYDHEQDSHQHGAN